MSNSEHNHNTVEMRMPIRTLSCNAVLFTILVIANFVTANAAPVEFPNQGVFDGYLNVHLDERLETPGPVLYDHNEGVDYIFQAGFIGEISGTVFVRETWDPPLGQEEGNADAAEGVSIRFEEDGQDLAGLLVTGQFYVNTSIEGNAIPENQLVTFEGSSNGIDIDNWKYLKIVGGGLPDRAIIRNARITGGGGTGSFGQVEIGDEGQIQPNYVTLIDCELLNSNSHGVAMRGTGAVVIEFTEIHDTRVSWNGNDRFQGSGVLFRSCRWIPAPNYIQLNSVNIYNCNYGFYSFSNSPEIDENPPNGDLFMDNSQIHDNWDSGIRVEGMNNWGHIMNYQITGHTLIYNNGLREAEPPEGWGINITRIHNPPPAGFNPDIPYAPPASYLLVSEKSEIYGNAWGGIRCWDVNLGITLQDISLYNNAFDLNLDDRGDQGVNFAKGQGVRVRLWRKNANEEYGDISGAQSFLNVLNCRIYENGFEGIAVCKGRDDDQPEGADPVGDLFYNDHTNIVGNDIYDNGRNCANLPLLTERDARRGANVHILEKLHHVDISHNTIRGAISGVCWDITQDPNPNEDRASANIVTRNNTITDALLYGFFGRRHFIPDPLGDDVFPSLITNNVLWDNGKASQGQPEFLPVANLRIDPLPLPYYGMQCESNLIGVSDDYDGDYPPIGIYYTILDWQGLVPPIEERFKYNAFVNHGSPPNSPADWPVADVNWQNEIGPNFFSPTAVYSSVGDAGLVNVSDDPVIISDFHCKWFSGSINLGRSIPNNADPTSSLFPDWDYLTNSLADALYPRPDNQVMRDGSQNDVGLFGGEWSEGYKFEDVQGAQVGMDGFGDPFFDFWALDLQAPMPRIVYLGPPEEATQGEHKFDPYCQIDETADELDGTLQWDYYRAFSDYNVPQNEELLVEGGAYIENHNLVKFVVHGLIEVDGQADAIVTFTNYPNETWGGMQIQLLADVNSSISYTDISGALTGLYIGNVSDDPVNPAQRINLENLVVENCEYQGISIYNSRVRIHGEHPNHENPANPNPNEPSRNRVRFIQESVPNELSTEAGIRISTCGYNAQLGQEDDRYDVVVEDSYIGECATPDEGVLTNSGLALLNTDGRIDNVTMHNNGVTGMSVSWCGANLNCDGDVQNNRANDLRDNGINLAGGQANANGAEAYISGVPLPTLEAQDYNDNNGKLVYHTAAGVLDVRDSWWGEELPDPNDPLELPMFEAWVQNRLYPESRFLFDFGAIQDEGDIDIDDFEFTFDDASLALNDNQPQQALEIMESLIADQPESNDGQNAARYIHLPYRLLNRSTESLFEYYRATAARFDTLEIASICRLMIPRILLEEQRFDEARQAYQSLVDNPRSESESILAQIGILELDYSLNEGNLDSHDPRARMMQAGNLLKQLNETANQGNTTLLPKDYAIFTPYPNPFNSVLSFQYSLPTNATIRIEAFDLSGRLVETIFSGEVKAGIHRAVWNSGQNGSGLYFLRMTTPKGVHSTKALLIK